MVTMVTTETFIPDRLYERPPADLQPDLNLPRNTSALRADPTTIPSIFLDSPNYEEIPSYERMDAIYSHMMR